MDLKLDTLRFLRAHDATSKMLWVGCSGGSDSLALAHVMSRLALDGAIPKPGLIHVNHGLRPEAANDADLVVSLGKALSLETEVVKVVVPAQASLEAAAREARYGAFEKVAAGTDSFVATAHTKTDQSETLLMRLIRGTGIAGLGGIPPKRDRYLRPFLNFSRLDIENYLEQYFDEHLKKAGIHPVTDEMNADERFFRVRVRSHWLPTFRKENPKVDEALCRLAKEARELEDVVEYAGAELLAKATSEESAGAGAKTHLHIPTILAAPLQIQRNALRSWLGRHQIGPIDSAHFKSIRALLNKDTAGTQALDLPGGQIYREYDELVAPSRANASQSDSKIVEVKGLDTPYIVRNWQPGDRFRPARLAGRHRKLARLFVDLKVPKRVRESAKVIVNASGEIIWAEHVGLAFQQVFEVNLTTRTTVAMNTH